MKFRIYIFFLLLIHSLAEPQLSASSVRKLMRATKTYYEFQNKFNILVGVNVSQSMMVNPANRAGSTFETIRINPNLKYIPHGLVLKKEDNLPEVIEDPVQSQDSCKVVKVCAPLPVQKEPNMYYFPECIDLPQCLGGCCDNSNRCQPTSTEPVRVKVRSWLYLGNVGGKPSFKLAEELFVTVEKHIKCSCHNCDQKIKCKENQIVEDCQCKCINDQDAELCTGSDEYWSNEKCLCQCKNDDCSNSAEQSYRFGICLFGCIFLLLIGFYC